MANPPPPPTTNPRIVPVPAPAPTIESHEGGGGTPSTTMGRKPLTTFSAPIISYLKEIHTKDPSASTISLEEFFTQLSTPTTSSAMSQPLPSTTDLTHPISNYFISTSHNTYLSGNQLYGEASTEAYTNVLLRGCRCLEIDVWNGDESPESSDAEGGDKTSEGKETRKAKLSRFANKIKDRTRPKSPSATDTHGLHNPLHHTTSTTPSVTAPTAAPLSQPSDRLPDPWRSTTTPAQARTEPRVLHGHTLTKEVSFRSVCTAIRDNAFTASPLPIIVSLEVHANLSQQEIMVEIMRETWTGLLVDLTEAEADNVTHLPSPEYLKHKILIKVKWSPKPGAESNNPLDHVASGGSEDESTTATVISTTSPNRSKKAKKASKILHDLARLGIYTRAYTFKSFDTPESSLPNHVFSLSEQKVIDMHESLQQAAALFNHNRNYLLRVFPSGLRVNSSNVEPTFLWRQGAQMVALNWQKCDRGMMLNEGMFAGQQGWVLKPQSYLGTLHTSTLLQNPPTSTPSTLHRKTLTLTLTLLAGQSIPLPPQKDHASSFHPYVKLQLHLDQNTQPPGSAMITANPPSEEDDEVLKRRSKTSRSQDPDFHAEELRWHNLPGVMEDLSFLRLKIQHDRIGSDDLAAWACIRLDRLQSGYRFIHLLDAKGMESEGALLVNISKTFA